MVIRMAPFLLVLFSFCGFGFSFPVSPIVSEFDVPMESGPVIIVLEQEPGQEGVLVEVHDQSAESGSSEEPDDSSVEGLTQSVTNVLNSEDAAASDVENQPPIEPEAEGSQNPGKVTEKPSEKPEKTVIGKVHKSNGRPEKPQEPSGKPEQKEIVDAEMTTSYPEYQNDALVTETDEEVDTIAPTVSSSQ